MTGGHLDVAHHTAVVNGIKVHYVIAGTGPPVFLLHGFPEFWYAWRHQIPALAEKYTVVAPDLRGYGYSAKPFDDYDKRTMATDMRELARHLGFEKIALIGHDRSARVALRFVKDTPEMVDRVAFLDNVPTVVIFETMNAQYAVGQWWFIFNQIPHLPEALIAGREEIWLRHFFTDWCHDPQTMTPEDIAEYVRAYEQPGAVMGACNDYRAGPEDVAQDQEDRDKRIQCPVLALWGEDFDPTAGRSTWRRSGPDSPRTCARSASRAAPTSRRKSARRRSTATSSTSSTAATDDRRPGEPALGVSREDPRLLQWPNGGPVLQGNFDL